MKVIAILLAFSSAGVAQIGIFGGNGDVGETPKAGASAVDAAKDEYRITGGGANVWGAKDAFQFLWKRASGDITLTADVHFVGAGAVPHRKAMLMIRQGLEPGAAYADIALHGSGLTSLQYRPKADEATIGVPSKIEAPVRIRIERRGDRITAYAGEPGKDLAPIGPATVVLQGPVYVGLGVCSHDANVLETALFTNVTLEAGPAPAQSAAVKSFVTLYDVASGDRKVVFTGNGFYQAPNWSPDGSYLLLNTPGKLWRLPLSTGVMEPIATGDVKATQVWPESQQ
jgi:TolB protein